jgi:cytidine deaminase
MQKLNVTISLESYDSETELSAKEQLLLMEARKATYKSYAPYSQFHVGAAILLEDDTIITANNQENAAFPSGSCAEQSAIFWVGANHPDKKIKSIAVIARPGKETSLEVFLLAVLVAKQCLNMKCVKNSLFVY